MFNSSNACKWMHCVFNQAKDRITLHCPTAGTPRWQCTEYPRLDAFTLGLVTATETVSLQLPDSMRPRMP